MGNGETTAEERERGGSDRMAAYVIAGVCCSTEEEVLKKHLRARIGGEPYRYNPVTCELEVGRGVPAERVLELVREAGFAGREKQEPPPAEPFLVRHTDAVVTGLALLLFCSGLVLDRAGLEEWGRVVQAGAILLGGARVARRAVIALRTFVLDMNVLMTVAVVGAVAIGRWEEGAAVVVLFAVALMLESYSTERTRRAVRSLMSLKPETASVLREGTERTVRAGEVGVGETVVIRPGERIPLDGEVVEGGSTVNESEMTGESAPVPKRPGDRVTGGTLNEHGVLLVRSTRRAEDTTIARIVQLIEEAQHQRAPVQSFVDRFARIYTPAVFALALSVALLPPLLWYAPFEPWFYRALVLLVIACPCALVISVPVTLVSGLTNAARRGILVKGGRHLEAMSHVRTMAFDKTGTLTHGRPVLTDVVPLGGMTAGEVLRLAAVLEFRSGHHLAGSVLKAAGEQGIRPEEIAVREFASVPGQGVRGVVEGGEVLLGNEGFLREHDGWSDEVHRTVERLRAEGNSTMVLGRPGTPLGVIAVRDAPRPHAAEVLAALKQGGISEIVILSGDHEAAVDIVAEELEIDGSAARLLPSDKMEAIRGLNKRAGGVAMVGDGVNDAPALSAATVGIAMGVSGADVALETADIILVSDDLRKLPHLIGLSRRTMSIIRQNIALALGIKLLFVALSLAGMSTLWMALLADDGAALIVIVNGLRVLAFEEGKARFESPLNSGYIS
jgi:Cd2+/Zn2+-exporting ATPase